MIKLKSKDIKNVRYGGDWELKFEIPEVNIGQRVYLDANSTDMDSQYDKKEKKWYYIAKKYRPLEKTIKKVKAKELLQLIAKNMCENAEPGIQNIDIARKYSNSDYVYDPNDIYDSRIIGTNACCLVEESVIMTDRGSISIREIYEILLKNPKEEILAMSYNVEGQKYEFKPILSSWQKRDDATVELEIEESGKIYKIECSGDHPIMTKNRGYVQAKSLTYNDDIMIF